MSRSHPQRGASLVEAVFVILILFLFLDAVLEFGRLYNIYHVVTNAAREGARYAVCPQPGTTNRPTGTEVQSYVAAFVASGGLAGANVYVNPSSQNVNGVALDYTTVTVTAPYTFTASQLLFGSNGPGTITVASTAEMRNETN